MLKLKKWIALNRGFLLFMLGMLFVRSAVADWYGVPSSSMYPTLIIGARILTDRLAYDVKLPFTDIIVKHIADPQRGDIVTFSSPEDGMRLVKRVIGVPGDVVEMHNDQLTINHVTASYGAATGAVAARVSPDYPGEQVVLSAHLFGQQRAIIEMPERPALRT